MSTDLDGFILISNVDDVLVLKIELQDMMDQILARLEQSPKEVIEQAFANLDNALSRQCPLPPLKQRLHYHVVYPQQSPVKLYALLKYDHCEYT